MSAPTSNKTGIPDLLVRLCTKSLNMASSFLVAGQLSVIRIAGVIGGEPRVQRVRLRSASVYPTWTTGAVRVSPDVRGAQLCSRQLQCRCSKERFEQYARGSVSPTNVAV